MGGPLRTLAALALAAASAGSAATSADAQAELPSRTVRVAAFVDPPFVMESSSGRWDGFAAVTLQGASVPARLVLEFHPCASLEELFAEVESGKADIGLGNTLVTGARLSRVDFTQPILDGGLRVMVPSEHSHSLARLWEGLVSDGHVRVVAWGAAITVGLSLVVVFLLRQFDPGFTPHLRDGVAESFYHVVSVTMTGKTSYKGNVAPGWIGRVVAALWLVFGVASVAYLTSSLTSVMTANTLHGRIHGPGDLRGKTVGALKGSFGERWCAQQGMGVRAFGSVQEAAEATVAGEVDAVVADAQSLEYFDTTHPSVAVKVVGETFEKRHYAFAVRPGDDDLLRRLNVGILSLREDGVLDRVRSHWFGH